MSPSGPRLLVLAPGELGQKLIGPEIRALEFARALSSSYRVTIAAHRRTVGERDGIRVVPIARHRLLAESARHDAVLAACVPPYLLALRAVSSLRVVADLYDPHEQELATLSDGRERERELRTRASIQALQLGHSDLVLCASERQREELLRFAAALPGAGRRAAPSPTVIPFGIPDVPPPSGDRPLRRRFSQIAERDSVVLWWGSVWRWLDAETAVRAFALIAHERGDVKLVITAGRSPNSAGQRFDATEQVRDLARELGVLDRSVLFLDEWIPYERRHDYLREADLGLTLHRHAEEARLAARARYMDYLSAGLPCVLGGGDEIAQELGAAGFARILEPATPEGLAQAVLSLLADPNGLAAARAAGARIAADRRWETIGERLRTALDRSIGGSRPRPPRAVVPTLAGTSAYYLRRLADRLALAG